MLAILAFVLQKPIGKLIKYSFKFVISPSAWRRPQKTTTNQSENDENIGSKTLDKLIELVSVQTKLSETLVKHSILKRDAPPAISTQPSGIEILESHVETTSNIAFGSIVDCDVTDKIINKPNDILKISQETNTSPMGAAFMHFNLFANISSEWSQEYLVKLTAVIENLENQAITSNQAKSELLILYQHYMDAFYLIEQPAQRVTDSVEE